jgi:hypothetical protein
MGDSFEGSRQTGHGVLSGPSSEIQQCWQARVGDCKDVKNCGKSWPSGEGHSCSASWPLIGVLAMPAASWNSGLCRPSSGRHATHPARRTDTPPGFFVCPSDRRDTLIRPSPRGGGLYALAGGGRKVPHRAFLSHHGCALEVDTHRRAAELDTDFPLGLDEMTMTAVPSVRRYSISFRIGKCLRPAGEVLSSYLDMRTDPPDTNRVLVG